MWEIEPFVWVRWTNETPREPVTWISRRQLKQNACYRGGSAGSLLNPFLRTRLHKMLPILRMLRFSNVQHLLLDGHLQQPLFSSAIPAVLSVTQSLMSLAQCSSFSTDAKPLLGHREVCNRSHQFEDAVRLGFRQRDLSSASSSEFEKVLEHPSTIAEQRSNVYPASDSQSYEKEDQQNNATDVREQLLNAALKHVVRHRAYTAQLDNVMPQCWCAPHLCILKVCLF